jgi:hypothetical protein
VCKRLECRDTQWQRCIGAVTGSDIWVVVEAWLCWQHSQSLPQGGLALRQIPGQMLADSALPHLDALSWWRATHGAAAAAAACAQGIDTVMLLPVPVGWWPSVDGPAVE